MYCSMKMTYSMNMYYCTCTCTVYMYTRTIGHDIILKLHIKFNYQTYNNSYQLPVRFRSIPHSVSGLYPLNCYTSYNV